MPRDHHIDRGGAGLFSFMGGAAAPVACAPPPRSSLSFGELAEVNAELADQALEVLARAESLERDAHDRMIEARELKRIAALVLREARADERACRRLLSKESGGRELVCRLRGGR